MTEGLRARLGDRADISGDESGALPHTDGEARQAKPSASRWSCRPGRHAARGHPPWLESIHGGLGRRSWATRLLPSELTDASVSSASPMTPAAEEAPG